MSSNLQGLDQLSKTLSELARGASGEQMVPAIRDGGFIIEGYAKINVRDKLNKHPTGNLMNSIQTQTTKVEDTLAEVSVGTGVEYAAIHEFGGIIVPKKASGALVFFIDGQRIVTMSVNMPARPYLRPAADEHLQEIEAVVLSGLYRSGAIPRG